jgi:hypothetical protein
MSVYAVVAFYVVAGGAMTAIGYKDVAVFWAFFSTGLLVCKALDTYVGRASGILQRLARDTMRVYSVAALTMWAAALASMCIK